MSRFNKVNPALKARIFAYNKKLAAESEAAADMQYIAARIGALPKGQMDKLLTGDVITLLAKYGVVV